MKNRVITVNTIHDAREILRQIGVSSQGVEVMAPKALGKSVLLYNVVMGCANILKQECLIIGADCAMSKGIVEGEKPSTTILLMGGANKLLALITRMRHYTSMGLPEIREELLSLRAQMMFNSLHDRGRGVSPKVMGILNVTPDSFSDGSNFLDIEKAVQHGLEMEQDGASIIDIGGESTRPGSQQIEVEEEISRTIPVIKALRKKSAISISIDTSKYGVALEAIKAGASIINDITALSGDDRMVDLLVEFPHVKVCLMHKQGNPQTMQDNPNYGNVINEIMAFFIERIGFCASKGINKERIIVDPGIGFGKRHEDNLEILKRIDEFNILGCEVLLGASRKSFISRIYDASPQEREAGTMATTALAFQKGIDYVRLHEVKESVRLIKTLGAISKQKMNI